MKTLDAEVFREGDRYVGGRPSCPGHVARAQTVGGYVQLPTFWMQAPGR
jgi:hypothetical protein